MIGASQRELLRRFFAGFFEQDWRDESGSPEQVVTNYATQMNDRAALPELSEATLAFIDEHPDEDDLADALFRELGCYYSPRAIGRSTKEWLLYIAERVRAEQQR